MLGHVLIVSVLLLAMPVNGDLDQVCADTMTCTSDNDCSTATNDVKAGGDYACCGTCKPVPFADLGEFCGSGCNSTGPNPQCGSDGMCINNVCWSNVAMGCDCPPGGCRSIADSYAGEEGTCIRGKCMQATIPPTYPCMYDEQCGAGVCTNNKCAPGSVVPKSNTTCPGGYVSCIDGMYCDAYQYNGAICMPKVAPGGACQSTNAAYSYHGICDLRARGGDIADYKMCTAGYGCISGTCQTSGAGTACTQDMNCPFGYTCNSQTGQCQAWCSIPTGTPVADGVDWGDLCAGGNALNGPTGLTCADCRIESDAPQAVTYEDIATIGPLAEVGQACSQNMQCDPTTHAFASCTNPTKCASLDGQACTSRDACGVGNCACNSAAGKYQCTADVGSVCKNKASVVQTNMNSWEQSGGLAIRAAMTAGLLIATQTIPPAVALSIVDAVCCQQCYVAPLDPTAYNVGGRVSHYDIYDVRVFLRYFNVDCATMTLTKLPSDGFCRLNVTSPGISTGCDTYLAAQAVGGTTTANAAPQTLAPVTGLLFALFAVIALILA